MDVRMLGRGRPFMLELLNPKCTSVTQDLVTQMQERINANSGHMIKVADLQMVTKCANSIATFPFQDCY